MLARVARFTHRLHAQHRRLWAELSMHKSGLATSWSVPGWPAVVRHVRLLLQLLTAVFLTWSATGATGTGETNATCTSLGSRLDDASGAMLCLE